MASTPGLLMRDSSGGVRMAPWSLGLRKATEVARGLMIELSISPAARAAAAKATGAAAGTAPVAGGWSDLPPPRSWPVEVPRVALSGDGTPVVVDDTPTAEADATPEVAATVMDDASTPDF
jgi:hypothetical protein